MKNDTTKDLSDTAILSAATQIGILKTLVQILTILGMGLLFIICTIGVSLNAIHLNWISVTITLVFGFIFLIATIRSDIIAARSLINVEDLLEKYEQKKDI